MVAGHLSEKNGTYYAVLTYSDRNGKRKSKWISTGLPVKGNKKKAEAFLLQARQEFQPEEKNNSAKMYCLQITWSSGWRL